MRRTAQRAFDLLKGLPATQRLRASVRRWMAAWPELVGIVLMFLTLEIPILSIEQAEWISPQPSLTAALFLAVAATSILVGIRLPSAVPHFIVLALGVVVTLWQGSSLMTEVESTSRVGQLLSTLYYWWQATGSGQTTSDTAHFAVFLVLFTWILGYLAAWSYWRRWNPWVAAIPGALTILVNLSNLTEKHYVFFFLYLLVAVLFIGYTGLLKRTLQFRRHGIAYPVRSTAYVLASVLCLTVITTSLVWAAPVVPVKKFEIASDALFRRELDDFLTRFLSGVAVQQPYLSSAGQRTLSFVDPIDRSYTVHFVMSAKRPFYWRVRSYNLYTSKGWTVSQTTDNMSGQLFPGGDPEKLLNRGPLTHTVIPKLKTDILPGAGEFISTDVPVSVEALAPPTFGVSLVSAARDSLLPADLAAAARSLRFTRSAAKTFTINDMKQRLPEDTVLSSLGENRDAPSEGNFDMLVRSRRLSAIEVSRKAGARDVLAAISSQLLIPDQRIRVTVSVSTATPADLLQAGEKYPNHITDFYLQLPQGLPDRVRATARAVTQNAPTPYQKAVAVKNYLQQFQYNATVTNPPPAADGVDHFLFTLKEGNCFYFASAMAVMLRSVGVPARMVAGYLPGEWDETSNVAIVRAKDYHSWVEVYFPRYGWLEFDPTPATAGAEPGIFDEDILLEEEIEDGTLLDGDDGILPFEWPTLNISLPGLGFPIALLVMLLGLAVYVWQKYFAGLDYVSGMYARMCFLGSLARIAHRPYLTPVEYCDLLASAFPAQTDAIARIGQTYVTSRYAKEGPPNAGLRNGLRQSWRSLYPALLKRLLLLG